MLSLCICLGIGTSLLDLNTLMQESLLFLAHRCKPASPKGGPGDTARGCAFALRVWSRADLSRRWLVYLRLGLVERRGAEAPSQDSNKRNGWALPRGSGLCFCSIVMSLLRGRGRWKRAIHTCLLTGESLGKFSLWRTQPGSILELHSVS